MPEKLTSPPTSKLLGLELLRFVAAFAVLIWHYQHFAYVADKAVGLTRTGLPLYGLLQPFYEVGEYGVWLFWCISGYIFFWKYRDTIHDRTTDSWTFFVLRLSRLYPLHLATLALVAILQPIYFHLNGYFFVYQDNDIGHFLLQLVMASNWGLQSALSFDGPVWSISVEVLVYVLFFLLLRFGGKSALLNLVIIVGCVGAKGQLFTCLSFFYIGGLAAIARRAIAATAFRDTLDGIVWLVVIVAPLLAWMFALYPIGWLDYALLAYMPAVIFCLARDVRLPARAQRLIEAAGNMTYSSYLLHFPIQLLIVVGFATVGAPIPIYETTFFVAFVSATLLASYLAYRYFEAPAQNFIRGRLLPWPGAAGSAHTLTEIHRRVPRGAD
ncbi:MAG TPA: acyltransferase [Bradyrhizobium sp.]|jgi:peptidoglycan/LPS O-acetylase OafA/YrhL|nr:acyltransferase [Bradyrhizobium sp.]